MQNLKKVDYVDIPTYEKKGAQVDRGLNSLLSTISFNRELIDELWTVLSVPRLVDAKETKDQLRPTVSEVLDGASEQIEENNIMLKKLLDEIKGQIGDIKLL